LTTTTSAASLINETDKSLSPEEYWCIHAYYQVIDSVIINMEDRFSEQSLKLATSIDNLFKLNYEKSKYFVDQYEVRFVI